MAFERQREDKLELIAAFKKVVTYLREHPEIDVGIPKESLAEYAAIIAKSKSGDPGYHLGAIHDQARKDWQASPDKSKQDTTSFTLKELREVSLDLALKQLKDLCPQAFVAQPKPKPEPQVSTSPAKTTSTSQIYAQLKASPPPQAPAEYENAWSRSEGRKILNAIVDVIGIALNDKQYQVNDKDRQHLQNFLRTIASEGKNPNICITNLSYAAMELLDKRRTPAISQRIYTALYDLNFDDKKDATERIGRLKIIPSRSSSTASTPRSESSASTPRSETKEDTESSESKSQTHTPRK